VAFGLFLAAAAQECNETRLLFEAPAHPTFVYLQVSTISLQKLDSVESSFLSDFYMNLAWMDDRLYADEEFDPACMWAVQPDFSNGMDSFGLDDVDLAIQSGPPAWAGLGPDHDGEAWVTLSGRKQG
jgi:hypothetical protein